MNLLNAILIGLKEVWAHKFRSLLTLFGVVLGVASLVGMSAIIKGMENGMRESMIAMGGADKVLLQRQAVPAYQEHLADQAPGRTLVDVMALKEGAPLLKVVSPEMAVPDVIVSRGERRASPEECVGVWPEVLDMNLHTVEHGRFFNAVDEEKAHSVCVIGTGIRDSLFGDPDEVGREIIPIGETIQINGQPFTIVGMFSHYASEQDLKARALRKRAGAEGAKVEPKKSRGWGRKGGWAFWRKNNTLYIPLNTAWVRFRMAGDTDGIPDPRLSDIDLKVRSMEQMELALQQAKNVLLVTHRGIEDFTFQTQENQVQSINQQIRNARLSGGIIAGISLLVGGIGIMNIMLASINERVREIGTCKALGATGVDVFIQIIVESMVLSLIGAVAGLAASLLIVDVLAFLAPTGNTPVITWEAQVVAVVFSGTVGVVAGFLPAVKAARLEPIQALRYE
ncbi:MAG: ABC transporter permease [Verrucomicrobium sp.]|jgi:ABC-type antimicrobial peptide transport system permease subunit|nr:ABC transporter permease [Verrucomicrobium sp.]